ncbi:unnamed protein product [Paramecium octaurelia]|uniref:Uncharacterized protein n=1 Tax=Paramecium octaurelia TaxID=43137 RepID=A0A8S1YP37_PAROT|nr:unnamed protein product [Paramecium octaurelia]
MRGKKSDSSDEIQFFLQGKVLVAPFNTQDQKCFVVAAIQISNNEKYVAMIYQIQAIQLFLQVWDLESQQQIINQKFGTMIHREIKIQFSGDSEVIGINQRLRSEQSTQIYFLQVKTEKVTELVIPDFQSLISSEFAINYTGNKCIINQYDLFYVFNSIWDNQNYNYKYSSINNTIGYDVIFKFSFFYDIFYLFQKGQQKLELWTCYKDNKVKQIASYFDSYFIDDLQEMESNKQLLVNYKANIWSTNTVVIIYLPKFSIIRKISLSSHYKHSDILTLLPRTDLILQLKHKQRKRVDEFMVFKQQQDNYHESFAKLTFTQPEAKVLYAPILIEENSFLLISKSQLLQVIKDRVEIYSFKAV